ncbi:amino acid permease [Aureobasidium pullulans]|uniref:Amino acid permease n=1 Tax=Aureobasidium pullulans TaxID=5580 RepID=A0A4S8ZCR6_AURPU|nr:amino acid permease [Aureobasidium pullulans]THW61935.1 amino acid permease [Aureobasidium pullulans]
MRSSTSHDAIHSSSIEPTGSSDTVKVRNSSKAGVETYNETISLPEYGGESGGSVDSISLAKDGTHRRLKSRHIQLIGIGGTIGTALYVSIGNGLLNGGPASLFLAFSIWCSFILAVTISTAEMVTYLPISSPFIRFASRYMDEAMGFAAGWNFFVFEAILACRTARLFSSIGLMSSRFHSKLLLAMLSSTIGVILSQLEASLLFLINVLTVEWYGETEFWAALGKVLLIIGLIIFTFIVMLGGNPLGDRFGFRYWNNPGAFAPLYYGGNLGYFLGFLQCLIQASFTIAGPDYVSMAAGEAENPRVVMPKAFKAVFYRLTTFFMLGSLCVGILVPYNDKELIAATTAGLPGAAASPYVVAMDRLRISVLPHIVNAMVLASAFSAGNSYVYCASRSLYGLALEGKAPKILTRTTRRGVPIYCTIVVLCIALLAFLQVSSNAATVLKWFINLVTASQLINYAVMCMTFICWKRACDAQGFDRNSLPFKGWGQPYLAWYGFVGCTVMAFVGGYTVFLPGKWDVPTFIFSYFMIGLFPVLFVGWKLIKKTKWTPATQVDLRGEVEEIEEYQASFVPSTAQDTYFEKALDKLFG